MKLYNKALIIISLLAAILPLRAQETCPLPVMVRVDGSDGTLTKENARLLTQKLTQLVSTQGFGSNAELSHLCLLATISDRGDREVISGTRPVFTGTFDVYLVLTNLLSGENFGSESFTVKGSGTSEGKMMQTALSRINPSNASLQRFIQNSKVKTFDYYRSHLPSIIGEANNLSERGDYDKALYILSTVPPCIDGYEKVEDAMMLTFTKYLDVDCHQKLAKANAIWTVNKDSEGAAAAAAYIAAIDHRSSCYGEARELLSKISDKLDADVLRQLAIEDEERNLEIELIRGEADLRKQKQNQDYQLRSMEIDALRQLSQAYVESVIGPLVRQNESQGDNYPAPLPSDGQDSGKGRPVIIVNN